MTENGAASDSPEALLGRELLREDFAGLYQEHMKAGEEFSGRRFRTVLLVQAVPLLVVGALISKVEGTELLKLDLLVSVVAAINFLYLTIAVAGMLSWAWMLPGYAMLSSAVYGLAWFGEMKRRFGRDQGNAEKRVDQL